MARIVIALLILTAIVVLFRVLLHQPEVPPQALVTAGDLAPFFEALRKSTDDRAFVIVTASGTEDFLQFQNSESGVYIDFPLVTDRQKSLAAAAREALVAEGFVIDENLSQANSSIDASADLSPEDAAGAAARLLQRIFGVRSDSQFKVEWDGIEPPLSSRWSLGPPGDHQH